MLDTKNLMYTEKDNTIFWVAGYCKDLNTSNVNQKIDSLKENAKRFADHCGIDVSDVNTYEIRNSRRYKNMRVFYSQKFPMEDVPSDAFIYEDGNGWTMEKVLHD